MGPGLRGAACAALLLCGCFLAHGTDEGSPCASEDAYHCCDPDECPCVCEPPWHCIETEAGRRCTQQGPDVPDDGGDGPWSCEYVGESILCTGDAADHPDAGRDGDWVCKEEGEAIECVRETDAGDVPDPEGGWVCSYAAGAEERACDEAPHGPVGWDCELDDDGRRTCTNRDPDMPDGDRWDCYRDGGADLCVGDHFPEDDPTAEWECREEGELVFCESDAQVPDETTTWDCTWGQYVLVCDETDEPVDPPECTCAIGAERYCDEPTFSNWGLQACEETPGAIRWDTCREVEIPGGCEPGGAHARDYEWHYAGGYWDGQVNDPDGDGVILMPPDYWFNPAAEDCAIRTGLCVQDMWDLDNDQDNQESTGACSDECR